MLADRGKCGVNPTAFRATAGNCNFLTLGKVLAHSAVVLRRPPGAAKGPQIGTGEGEPKARDYGRRGLCDPQSPGRSRPASRIDFGGRIATRRHQRLRNRGSEFD